MKTNDELIAIWNELPSQEKMAMGDHYIAHETNLKAWDKQFDELSPLKQKRVLQSIEDFSKVSFHGIIGSGINTNTLEVNQFKNGERIFSENELFKAMKKELKITNSDIAEITGLTVDSVKTMTQPNRELPAWAKSMIFVWKRLK